MAARNAPVVRMSRSLCSVYLSVLLPYIVNEKIEEAAQQMKISPKKKTTPKMKTTQNTKAIRTKIKATPKS